MRLRVGNADCRHGSRVRHFDVGAGYPEFLRDGNPRWNCTISDVSSNAPLFARCGIAVEDSSV